MRPVDEKLLELTAVFVRQRLKDRLSANMYFHNLEHTMLVVEGVKLIGSNSGISEDDQMVLTLSAFMHDLGYTEKYGGHEEASADIATAFLQENGYNPEGIEMVGGCIMATRFPQRPINELQCIICDADFYHFALDSYQQYAARLKKEWALNLNLVFTDEEWTKLNLEMLCSHEYFTPFAKQVLQEGKMRNIARLEALIN